MSAASAAVFRILFGVVASIGAVRFLAKGWVDKLYVEPTHHLTYPWFDWVQPLPSLFMHAHMAVLAVLGVCIALGYRYRLAITLYAIGFIYAELIDAALYLNHYWWVSITSLLMIGMPLHRMWSLDARAGRMGDRDGDRRTVPSWVVWTVRGQLAVVYIFAGIAKLQSDWLFHALPMQLWLADRSTLPLLGHLLDEPATAYVASWAGALFDCTIVIWLLWSRSRPFAYMAVVGFHLATAALFQIGVFPWLMIGGTLIFFSPDWPLRGLRLIRAARASSRRPVVEPSVSTRSDTPNHAPTSRLVVLALCTLAVIEITTPMRHLAYPGDVRWNEEGYYGSWRVMLTEKTGDVEFRVHDPDTGENWRVGPERVLTDWQSHQASIRPDLLLTTAHLIDASFQREGHRDVQVRADAFVSFNGRPNQRVIDPTIDLSTAARGPGHKDFVLPLQQAPSS